VCLQTLFVREDGRATLIASSYRNFTGRRPIDVAHEGGNVGIGVRAEFQVIRVLVHVEGEYGHSPCDALIMLRRDLVDEPPVARNIGEQHPANETPASPFAIPDNSRASDRPSRSSFATALASVSGSTRPSPPRLAKYNRAADVEFGAQSRRGFRRASD